MAEVPTTLTGGTVSIIEGVPTSETDTAYEALSYTEIGKILTVPETGNSSEAGSVSLLKNGITQHYNGTKVVSPFVIPYVYDRDDAGQVIVRAGANGTTEHTLVVTDADGDDYYIQGVIGPVMTPERAPNNYKGETFEFRPITLFHKVDGS